MLVEFICKGFRGSQMVKILQGENLNLTNLKQVIMYIRLIFKAYFHEKHIGLTFIYVSSQNVH